MTREQLIGGVLVALIAAAGAFLASRRRPVVDISEAVKHITEAAETATRSVTAENIRLTKDVANLRREVADLRDELRTAKAQIDVLRHDLGQERADHEETREQVHTLLHELRRFTEHTPPDGNPIVGN